MANVVIGMKTQFFKCSQELEAESFGLHALNLNLYLKRVLYWIFYFGKTDILSVFKVKTTLNVNNATALTCCVF